MTSPGHVGTTRPRPVAPSIRPADRGPAVRAAAAGGRGLRGDGVRPVRRYEAFQGGCPIWRCDPRTCAHLKSSAGYRIRQVHHASRLAPRLRAIRPADRGPAVRAAARRGEGGRGECWARAHPRGVSGGCRRIVCDPRSCAHLKSPSLHATQLVRHASRIPCDPHTRRPAAPVRSGQRSGGPAVRWYPSLRPP